MSSFGLAGLLIAFAGTAVSLVCLLAGSLLSRKQKGETASLVLWAGHIGALLVALALTACCGVLVFCFMAGDYSILYVLNEHSNSTDSLAWLYKLSGLWAGREGSLLFWAWLIALFGAVIAIRDLKETDRLDSLALLVLELVLAAFVGVLLFSENNMPFTATPASYFDASGNLSSSASVLGMNTLLEHWAMAIHPPTLFVGYAGFTVPFAYAVAALLIGDASKQWVMRAQRYLLVSWLFLGFGIGLGAIWAYVVLGWGGYWGWDPVENASLLSWLVGVALIHSFTVYRQRDAFKRWSIMCSCLAFCFVIVGTFISRSGIVQSVHAFEGDLVSLTLFGSLIVLSVLVGLIGLALRWKAFGPKEGEEEMESMLSKDAAYYFNNVIMVIATVLLAYLTVASALPSWMPFGGQSLSAGTYNAIARPCGIVYLAILALCPLLAWGKTDKKTFLKQAKLPAICALLLFVLLMVYWASYLVPSYQAIISAGGIEAEGLAGEGSAWYYNGLAAIGFLVASVLFFNSLFILGRFLRGGLKDRKEDLFSAFASLLRRRGSTLGGFIAHLGMSIILIGLIGSSMYVTKTSSYLPYDEETDTVSQDFAIQDFTLEYTGNTIEVQANEDDILFTLSFDVFQNGTYLTSVEPAVQLVQSTQQQKLIAGVVSLPTKDLFIVYYGVDENGAFSIEARVNPLISLVWAGFFILMLGTAVALIARRRTGSSSKKKAAQPAEQAKVAASAACPASAPELEAAPEVERELEAEAAGASEAGAKPKVELADEMESDREAASSPVSQETEA